MAWAGATRANVGCFPRGSPTNCAFRVLQTYSVFHMCLPLACEYEQGSCLFCALSAMLLRPRLAFWQEGARHTQRERQQGKSDRDRKQACAHGGVMAQRPAKRADRPAHIRRERRSVLQHTVDEQCFPFSLATGTAGCPACDAAAWAMRACRQWYSDGERQGGKVEIGLG